MMSELSDYVRSSVATDTNGNQTPDFGIFSMRNDERGELFFPNLFAPRSEPIEAEAVVITEPRPAGGQPEETETTPELQPSVIHTLSNVAFIEIPAGPFQRQIRLPLPVDPEQVAARQENGLLWITLPLAES